LQHLFGRPDKVVFCQQQLTPQAEARSKSRSANPSPTRRRPENDDRRCVVFCSRRDSMAQCSQPQADLPAWRRSLSGWIWRAVKQRVHAAARLGLNEIGGTPDNTVPMELEVHPSVADGSASTPKLFADDRRQNVSRHANRRADAYAHMCGGAPG
jgi:hypothetical protein